MSEEVEEWEEEEEQEEGPPLDRRPNLDSRPDRTSREVPRRERRLLGSPSRVDGRFDPRETADSLEMRNGALHRHLELDELFPWEHAS